MGMPEVALFLSVIRCSSGMVQAPSAKANLSVQGRLTVYEHVVASREKHAVKAA